MNASRLGEPTPRYSERSGAGAARPLAAPLWASALKARRGAF